MGNFRAVIIAGGSMFTMSAAALVLSGTCFSVGDHASYVTCVRLSVRAVVDSSSPKAMARCVHSANVKDERARANRVGYVTLERGHVTVNLCRFIIPIKVRVRAQVR